MDLPAYQTFLNSSNMNDFWMILKWLLFFVAPLVMIYVAFELVGWIASLVKKSVTDEDDENRRRRRYEEEDDYY